VKRAVVGLVRLLVGLFYRRVEVTGLENVPGEGPVLFVANHFNGLVDPMLVLRVVERPVVFVAKSTLWKIPVLRTVLDLLGCVPVVRRGEEDGKISSKGEERNRASFEKLAEVLDRDGAILIFPEGRSHSDPRLSEIRTGAARVLLLSKKMPVVLPVGLWFTRKEEFRSEVLVKVGPPVLPPPDPSVDAWTDAIEQALLGVTLNADDWEDHEVVAAVDALYGSRIPEEGTTGERTTGDFLEGEEKIGQLSRSFRTRQVLLEARATLEKTHPGDVASLARRALAFDHLLRRIGLSPGALEKPPAAWVILWNTFKALLLVLLGFPVAVLGVVVWWVPYRLCGVIANRVPGASEQRDQIALHKLVAGTVLFPLFLALETAAVWSVAGAFWAALALTLFPFAGILSLFFFEYASWREGQARELLALAFTPRGITRLRARRDALVAECDRLAEIYRSQTGDNRVS
jgi:glycerol-3-phosphate O-acyltransferase / dihydroxyacetone phosphate acyltransferase